MYDQDNSDKTSRSIFVGNIPYEATEEKLMNLFGKAGPVIGFRLVYDRDSGKPKGYGFCEYNSAEVARSALRNLNNIDFNGRPLRIGPAAGEQNNNEVSPTTNATVKQTQESVYGEKCETSECCKVISQRIANMPADQLRKSLIEFKEMVRDNPIEAKQMLLQNPQLGYGLVQGMIIMKMMDPKKAMSLMIPNPDTVPTEVLMRRYIDPLGDSKQKVNEDPSQFSVPTLSEVQPTSNFQPSVQSGYPIKMEEMPPDLMEIPLPQDNKDNVIPSNSLLDITDEDDKKRADLIFEVLRLSDEQVALLPEDQRKSIHVLKTQLKNQHD